MSVPILQKITVLITFALGAFFWAGRAKVWWLSLPGVKASCYFCSLARKFQGTKVPGDESSTYGTFIPWAKVPEYESSIYCESYVTCYHECMFRVNFTPRWKNDPGTKSFTKKYCMSNFAYYDVCVVVCAAVLHNAWLRSCSCALGTNLRKPSCSPWSEWKSFEVEFVLTCCVLVICNICIIKCRCY